MAFENQNRTITVPDGATTEPRIVIGVTELAELIGIDAAITFFNNATDGFLISIDADAFGGLWSLIGGNGAGTVLGTYISAQQNNITPTNSVMNIYCPNDPNGGGITLHGDGLIEVDTDSGPIFVRSNYGIYLNELVQTSNMTVEKITNTQNPTFTGAPATSYSDLGGASVLSDVFVAPMSGVVSIRNFGWSGSSATTVGRRTFNSIEVREGNTVGAGTVVYSPSDVDAYVYDNNSTAAGTKYQYGMHEHLIKSLTAGSQYNVRAMHKISNSADTGAVFNRHLVIEPMLQV